MVSDLQSSSLPLETGTVVNILYLRDISTQRICDVTLNSTKPTHILHTQHIVHVSTVKFRVSKAIGQLQKTLAEPGLKSTVSNP